MNYRQLGKTGISVSEIGMGCWGLGGQAYGEINNYTAIQTVHEALKQGINFFDTADIYGAGRSEEILGCFLSQNRDDMVIATKVGSIPHTGKKMPHILAPQHIRIACDASLMRLKVDYIDLYQLHSPPMEDVWQALESLEDLRRQGKIRFIGVSAKSPEDALAIVGWPQVDAIQVNFNMIDQRALDSGLLDRCAELGIGVITRTPLAFGFLTGRYSKGHKFEVPDHRANWSQEQIDVWAEAPEKFEWLGLCTGLNPIEQAIGFALHHPAISATIPGMMTPDEVRRNTEWVKQRNGSKMFQDEIDYIREVYRSNRFFIS